MALKVQPDYIDYMMGHTIDTYHDIQSKGVEFLRGIYARPNLRIAPTPEQSPLDQLKTFARGLGLDADRVIMAAAFAEPHRTVVSSPEESERQQTEALSTAIKDMIKDELLSELIESSKFTSGQVGPPRFELGSPASWLR